MHLCRFMRCVYAPCKLGKFATRFARTTPTGNVIPSWLVDKGVFGTVPVFSVPVWMSYRTYRSVRYRYWCTELTEASGTGIDVVPNLPKCPVPVIPAIYTGGMPRYVPYRTRPWPLVWTSSVGYTWKYIPGPSVVVLNKQRDNSSNSIGMVLLSLVMSRPFWVFTIIT